jgi:hypothetical protein
LKLVELPHTVNVDEMNISSSENASKSKKFPVTSVIDGWDDFLEEDFVDSELAHLSQPDDACEIRFSVRCLRGRLCFRCD